MRQAGVTRGPGTDAHHIVPRNHAGAQRARDVLARRGIDIDSHMNGVNLPRNSRASSEPGTLHNERGSSLNRAEYIDAVNNRIVAADAIGGRAGVLREMQRIRFDLLNGTMTGGRPNYFGGGIPTPG